MNKKKILIFGATGNIGVYLTDYLTEKFKNDDYEIIAVGRRKTDFFDKRGIKYICMDITDKKSYSMLPADNVFAAIHLANVLPAKMETENPYIYFDVNVKGTINILEYLKSVKADRIIFTQSYSDIAGELDKNKVLKPDMQRSLKFTGDHALYAISKTTAQDIIEYYHQTYGIKNFVLRLPNIYMYSPEEYYYLNGVKTLISYRYLIKRAIAGKPIELWGDPAKERDIIYIKDLCQLIYLTVITNRETGIYNAGTGMGTSFKDQIEGIIKVFCPKDKISKIVYCPEKSSIMEYIMDIENAKNELGYKPEYTYEKYLCDYKLEMKKNRFFGL